MGLLSRTLSADLLIPDGIRRVAQRRSNELAGAALVALALALGASLATWTIQDPSINHASGRDPQNLMGYPGAVIADLTIQLFGIAVSLLTPVLLRWGWLYLRQQPAGGLWLRAGASLVMIVMAAAFLGLLPAPASWPLPAGLGGFIGDWLSNLALYVTGGGFTGTAISGLVCLLAGLLAARTAMALDLSALLGRGDAGSDADEADEDEDEDGARAWLGAVGHAALSARARLLRLMRGTSDGRPRTRPQLEAGGAAAAAWARVRTWLAGSDDLPLEAPGLGGRREPVFTGGGHGGRGDPQLDDPGDDFDDGPDDGDVDSDPHPGAARHDYQIAPVRGSLRKGRRSRDEAQPSFLPGEAFQLPALGLLEQVRQSRRPCALTKDALEQNARMLEGVLEDFGVRGEIINVRPGPVVTLYELEPAPGIKSSRVIGLADDIARSMSAVSARVAVVPGRNAIGIELPNSEREMVYLRELLESEDFERSKARLPLALGKTIGGEPVIADLARMPHLLIAGTTGSGKSVGINTMILSLLYRLPPDKCKLIMIDPKMLELSVYDGIPHLLSPVVTDPKKAVVALKWTVREMEERYKLMSKLGVRNIDGYNQRVGEAIAKNEIISRTVQTGFDRETGQPVYETEDMELEPLPYLVVIVDEMADLMMVAGKDIEGAVQRLAQMARAAGIHMITATQRPSVDVITGTIKANFPTRISFQVTSKIDSRTILGEQGAEQLLGQGDMLYMAGGGRISRVHGPFVSDDNVERVVRHLKAQGTPQYLEDVTEEPEEAEFEPGGILAANEADDLYQKAIQVILRDKKASTSYIQRRLSIGYNRAASIMERLELEGVVSPANHAGKREILMEPGG